MSTRRGRSDGGLHDGKRRSFASVDQALNEAEARIFERRRAGWVEVGESGKAAIGPARNHELEAAIVDDLDDIAAWTVYADWLQARGDEFGEWLALSLAGSLPDSDPRSAGLWSTELSWLSAGPDVEHMQLEHRHGFVVRAWVGQRDAMRDGPQPERLLAALLHSPTARLLRRLTIGPIPGGVVHAMLGRRDAIVLEHLRELTLGEFVRPDERMLSMVNIGDLARVLRRCPSLDTLSARGSGIQCDSAIEHPRLASLTLEAVRLSGPVVEALVRGSLPNLRRLELWLGRHERDAGAAIEHLHPLFDDDRAMPKLRELALINCEFADAVAEALAHSNRLTRLEHVDLSQGVLGERGGRAILEHAARFRRLRSLELGGNYLAPELARALEDALPGVVRIGEQIDPAIGREGGPRGYYVAVGE
jgi:uncharacterized protein (TIGR02996 family)